MAAAAKGAGNKCGCKQTTCQKRVEEPCDDPKCTTCRVCCEAKCKGCEKNCQEGEPCKCYVRRCGCQTDCYKNNGECKGKGNCKRCERKCANSDKCICYRCSCGTQCNGVICSCCSWCDPRNCSGEKCDGYVIGRCRDKGTGIVKCQGHVKYYNGEPVWDREQFERDCKKSHGDNCNYNCKKWAVGNIDSDGNCVIYCTYCGTLCSQDWCRIWLGVLIIGLIILSCFIVMWGMFPETFHRMTTRIRAAFPSPARHTSMSLSNLVGDRLPEEMNIHRYPAFRPRAYAGLA